MNHIEEKILLSDDLCDFFIKHFENRLSNIIIRGNRYGKCGQEGLVLHEDIPEEFFSIFSELNIKPFLFSSKEQVHNLMIRKYVVGDSFPVHRDNNILNYDSGSTERGERYRSYILQLSDPKTYIGGDLMFDEYTIKSSRGNCVGFDAKLPHWVTEVMHGVRYSLVFWIKKSDLMMPQPII